MNESTYKIIELVGTSTSSWEDAAKNGLKLRCKNVNLFLSEPLVRGG